MKKVAILPLDNVENDTEHEWVKHKQILIYQTHCNFDGLTPLKSTCIDQRKNKQNIYYHLTCFSWNEQ